MPTSTTTISLVCASAAIALSLHTRGRRRRHRLEFQQRANVWCRPPPRDDELADVREALSRLTIAYVCEAKKASFFAAFNAALGGPAAAMPLELVKASGRRIDVVLHKAKTAAAVAQIRTVQRAHPACRVINDPERSRRLGASRMAHLSAVQRACVDCPSLRASVPRFALLDTSKVRRAASFRAWAREKGIALPAVLKTDRGHELGIALDAPSAAKWIRALNGTHGAVVVQEYVLDGGDVLHKTYVLGHSDTCVATRKSASVRVEEVLTAATTAEATEGGAMPLARTAGLLKLDRSKSKRSTIVARAKPGIGTESAEVALRRRLQAVGEEICDVCELSIFNFDAIVGRDGMIHIVDLNPMPNLLALPDWAPRLGRLVVEEARME